MKIFVFLILSFSSVAFASHAKLVSGQIPRYASGELNYYLTEEIEQSILTKAKATCGSLALDKIFDVTVQVKGSFVEKKVDGHNTSATATAVDGAVHVIYTALVTCK